MSLEDTRNLKKICSLLHDIRYKNATMPLNYLSYGMEIDALIATAEKVYHERKGDV